MASRYCLALLAEARDFIESRPKKEQGWFARQIQAVLDNPLDPRSRILRGDFEYQGRPVRRMRVSKNFRFLYSIDDEAREVTVIDAGWRKDIYRQ